MSTQNFGCDIGSQQCNKGDDVTNFDCKIADQMIWRGAKVMNNDCRIQNRIFVRCTEKDCNVSDIGRTKVKNIIYR